jgi:hypothetical protein
MKAPHARTADEELSNAAGSALGTIFKPFEYLWKSLHPSVRKFLLWTFFLLFLYPLIAFAAVVYLLDYLPDRLRVPLQERALASWGLERVYSTTSDLNRLNESVDTSTNLPSAADVAHEWNQYIVPGQKVRLWATTSRTALPGNSAECVADLQDVALGSFSFKIEGLGWSKPAEEGGRAGRVNATTKLVPVLRLDADDWSEIEKYRDNMSPLPLTILYRPAPQTAANALLRKCFKYDVDGYLEVYKPRLVTAGAAGGSK